MAELQPRLIQAGWVRCQQQFSRFPLGVKAQIRTGYLFIVSGGDDHALTLEKEGLTPRKDWGATISEINRRAMDTRKTTAETWAGQHPTETVCFCIISDDFSGIGKWTATNKYIAEAGTVRAIKVGIERRPNYPIVVIDPQGYYYRGVDVGFTLSQKGEPVVGGIPFQASGTLKRAA